MVVVVVVEKRYTNFLITIMMLVNKDFLFPIIKGKSSASFLKSLIALNHETQDTYYSVII